MFEFESLAGPIHSVHEDLAVALAAALDTEMKGRIQGFYSAIDIGAESLPKRIYTLAS